MPIVARLRLGFTLVSIALAGSACRAVAPSPLPTAKPDELGLVWRECPGSMAGPGIGREGCLAEMTAGWDEEESGREGGLAERAAAARGRLAGRRRAGPRPRG